MQERTFILQKISQGYRELMRKYMFASFHKSGDNYIHRIWPTNIWGHEAPFNFSVSSGTFSNKSPTSPTSATWKIGASPSLLIAAMTLLSFIPARCWMAPEMPAHRYSCGATFFPVCPTCRLLSANPLSTAALDAPIAAPNASANGGMI